MRQRRRRGSSRALEEFGAVEVDADEVIDFGPDDSSSRRRGVRPDFEEGLPDRRETVVKDAGGDEPPAPDPAPPKDVEKAAKREGLTPEELLRQRGDVPEVLTWAAVRKSDLPELGDSGLPESLAADVPPPYRYWKCDTREDALRVREALVEASLFTPETIREVNGVPRRVQIEPVVKLYLPPAYDDEEPPVVPPRRRAVEAAAGLLKSAERSTTIFDEDVVDALGIETILEKARQLSEDWILAARDTEAVRKAIGGAAFRLWSRADLIFATNAELDDPEAVEWVVGERPTEVLKFAMQEDREMRIFKADEERIVYGVVLEPDEVDAQGDTISTDEIRQACHKYMENYGGLGVQHRERVNGKLVLLENYIAPSAFRVGDEKVKKGTWLQTMRVKDDALWKGAKSGEYTGFSIGGSGIRRPA